jgi:hypothetical protein
MANFVLGLQARQVAPSTDAALPSGWSSLSCSCSWTSWEPCL